MCENVVQPDRPEKTIRRMRIACCIPKATNTHLQYVIITVFPLQQRLHERPSVLRYTYMGGSKIFRNGAVKIIKLTISPIGRRHPRSSSPPHVDTGPTVSSIFGTHPGSSFL